MFRNSFLKYTKNACSLGVMVIGLAIDSVLYLTTLIDALQKLQGTTQKFWDNQCETDISSIIRINPFWFSKHTLTNTHVCTFIQCFYTIEECSFRNVVKLPCYSTLNLLVFENADL